MWYYYRSNFFSGKLGSKTADIGIPQLAMHSIRAICGTVDFTTTEDLLKSCLLPMKNVLDTKTE
jgi:aspartyl aminopeptidase